MILSKQCVLSRNESNEFAPGREMAEVRERDWRVSDMDAEPASLLVRQLQKLFEQMHLDTRAGSLKTY